jgi:hypothetical protein
LATLLQDVVRVISGSPNYKITQFVDDNAILYNTNQGITGIFGPWGCWYSTCRANQKRIGNI